MYKKILLISSLLACSTLQVFAAGGSACRIADGPTPELANYVRRVSTELSTLTQNTANQCGVSKNGASAGADRALDVIDRSLIEFPIFDTAFLDFLYRIRTVAKGDMTAPVLTQGRIWTDMDRRIQDTIDNLARKCLLEDEHANSRTILKNLLSQNATLENIYKQAVIGTPSQSFGGLSDANQIVAREINEYYNPDATASCKRPNDVSSYDEFAAVVGERWIKDGKKNESGFKNWEHALLLFKGGGSASIGAGGSKISTAEYTAEQRKLLQSELGRQGLTQNMIGTMLDQFDCVKATATKLGDTPEAYAAAKSDCIKNAKYVNVYGTTATEKKKETLNQSQNLGDHVTNTEALGREISLQQDLVEMKAQVFMGSNPSITLKQLLITNLVDLHISLVSTNTILEQRTLIMQKNCMKGQTGIVGGCR